MGLVQRDPGTQNLLLILYLVVLFFFFLLPKKKILKVCEIVSLANQISRTALQPLEAGRVASRYVLEVASTTGALAEPHKMAVGF